MATQAIQPPQTDSPQLEASLEATVNPTQDFGTRIRSITYDAPPFKNAEEFRTAFEEAEKGHTNRRRQSSRPKRIWFSTSPKSSPTRVSAERTRISARQRAFQRGLNAGTQISGRSMTWSSPSRPCSTRSPSFTAAANIADG